MRNFLTLPAIALTLMIAFFASANHQQAFAAEAEADSCELQPEKNIVNAILNGDNDNAEQFIQNFDWNIALIPSPAFYRALAMWHKGYQQREQKVKTQGISKLLSAIEELESRHTPATNNLSAILALGLGKGYTARALMENEQYISGVQLGLEAIRHLSKFLQNADQATPGVNDAGFLMGLFEVYTHDLSNQRHWLVGKSGYHGDRSRGIELIEQSIIGPSVFANEASRTLLSEISWQMPTVCRYQSMIDQTGKYLMKNNDLAVLRQGLLLKCGYPELALQANLDSMQQDSPAVNRRQLTKAAFRIHADLGRHEALLATRTEPVLKPFQEFAIANAMDVSGLRDQAIVRYRGLVDGNNNPENIRTAAKVRMKFPYTAPERIAIPQLKIQHAQCGNN